MGYFLICSVCLVVLIVSAVYICTKMVQGTSFADVFRRVGCSIQSCFNAGYSQYARYKNRECSFPNLGLAASPYAYILEKELQLCKRCVLWQSYPINQDIQFLSFKLMGLTKVYEVTELVDLLTIELQQVYARHYGKECPLVYSVSFDQNIIGFWVATNLHGNGLIHQRANSDYYAEGKEPGALVDD